MTSRIESARLVRRVPRKTKAVFQIVLTICFTGLVGLYYSIYGMEDDSLHGRNLQGNNTPSCGVFALSDIIDVSGGSAKPLCPGYEGFLALTIFLMLYMFWALAVVIDEYFIPVLEFFEEYLNITPDVAGATLMAGGAGGPEFFTSLFSAINLTSTGFGTIMGSAVFNILVVIAFCAYFAKEDLPLEWWIIFRDSTYYTISIAVLGFFYACGNLEATYSCKGDGVMLVYEAVILFTLYIGYCVLLFTCHEWLRDKVELALPWVVPKHQRNPLLWKDKPNMLGQVVVAPKEPEIPETEDDDENLNRKGSLSRAGSRTLSLRDLRKVENDVRIPLKPSSACPDSESEMSLLLKIARFVAYLLSMPLVFFWNCHIPVVSSEFWLHEKRRKFRIFGALIAFLFSIIWIGVLTWIMVFSAETFGKTLGIPDIVMGYTFLAVGTSAPDLLSSIFVARKGEGGMAVSSSLGSNIFDITVSLSIPWLISTGIGNVVILQAESIVVSLVVLVCMLISVVAILSWQSWKLTTKLAHAMMVFYFVFMVAVIIPEAL